MTHLADTRPAASVTLSALGADPRIGLERAAELGVRAVQLSAGQAGTRPRDLGRSARRDLIAASKRLELTLSGVDAWLDPEDLGARAHADRAMQAVNDAVGLAADLGRLPVSLRLPSEEKASEELAAIAAMAAKVGVALADHTVPLGMRREGIGYGIDPAAWIAAREDLIEGITQADRPLVSVRLADLGRDGMRAPIGGEGSRLDVAGLLLTARAGGYDGPWIIDARQWVDVEGGVRRSLEVIGSR